MTQALMAHAYRWERIPAEQYMTWQLDPENQATGLIEAYSDGFEADPVGRSGKVRLIQCVVIRGYKQAIYAVAQ